MRIYLFNTDGWATQEYTKRTGDLPGNAHALPAGMQINLAFWNGSEIVEKTQPERDAYDAEQAAIAETARQEAKPLALKQAENEYLALLASLTVTLEPGDNSDTITQKLEASGMTEVEAVKIGLKLLNAIHEVEIKGGSWYDLPPQPHNI